MKISIKALIENLQGSMDTQSRISLEIDVNGKVNEEVYTDEDLMNATQIFHHVFGNKAISYWIKQWFSKEQLILLSEEYGRNIRQTILLWTGLDMHDVAKGVLDK